MDFVIPDHPVFKQLESQTLKALLLLCKARAFQKNSTVFEQGSPVDGLYFLTSGLVKITRLSIEGDQQLLDISCPGDVVGEMALYDDGVRSASVATLSDSQFTYIPKKMFFDFADEHPVVYRILLSGLSLRLRETNQSFARSHFLPVSGQVAAALVRLAETVGVHAENGTVVISEKFTHNDIATMVGAARENVSRVLGRLKKQGAIESINGHLLITDMEVLRKMSNI